MPKVRYEHGPCGHYPAPDCCSDAAAYVPLHHVQSDKNLHASRPAQLAAAQVLTHSLSGDWVGWSIEVRNAEGKKFFSLPVGNAAPIAA